MKTFPQLCDLRGSWQRDDVQLLPCDGYLESQETAWFYYVCWEQCPGDRMCAWRSVGRRPSEVNVLGVF